MVYNVLDNFLQGTSYTAASFCFFFTLNWIITQFLIPEHLHDNVVKKWRWRNYTVSLIHSTLSGSLALLCFALNPDLVHQVVLGYSELGYMAVCLTFGYFWYDTVDLVLNSDKEKGNRELVVHHGFALISAAIVVFTKTFVGFAVTSLVIELHSVTLHMRVLLKLYTNTQTSLAFQLLKYVNMVAFFVFRFVTLFYLVFALHRDRYSAENLAIYLFLCLTTSVILFLSCQLFMRVFRSDFVAKKAEVKSHDELLAVTTPESLMRSGNAEKTVI